MDSYRLEVRSAINLALADQNAQIEPVPMIGGGHMPEPELDRLSNILRSFNEHFGNIEWKDGDKIRNVISKDIPKKVSADKAYQNAMKNSDKQFSDNPAFKKWLAETNFDATYTPPPMESIGGEK